MAKKILIAAKKYTMVSFVVRCLQETIFYISLRAKIKTPDKAKEIVSEILCGLLLCDFLKYIIPFHCVHFPESRTPHSFAAVNAVFFIG